MARYRVPVEVYLYGTVTVGAPSLQEAMTKVNALEGTLTKLAQVGEKVKNIEVDGLLAIEPEIKKASASYKDAKKAKAVKVRKGDSKSKVTASQKGRGRKRG